MAVPTDVPDLEARVVAGLAERLKGNQFLKEGDLQKALAAYHNTILQLKGLDNSIQSFFGGLGGPAPTSDAEGEDKDAKTKEETKSAELKEKIKTGLALTHLNMAVVQIKKEKWARALQCSQESIKVLPEGPHVSKAKFREAQARIGLGELTKGKTMLQELQKTNPDIAIINVLKQLATDDKAREAKSSAQFKGLYAAKNAGIYGKEKVDDKVNVKESATIQEIKE